MTLYLLKRHRGTIRTPGESPYYWYYTDTSINLEKGILSDSYAQNTIIGYLEKDLKYTYIVKHKKWDNTYYFGLIP